MSRSHCFRIIPVYRRHAEQRRRFYSHDTEDWIPPHGDGDEEEKQRFAVCRRSEPLVHEVAFRWRRVGILHEPRQAPQPKHQFALPQILSPWRTFLWHERRLWLPQRTVLLQGRNSNGKQPRMGYDKHDVIPPGV